MWVFKSEQTAGQRGLRFVAEAGSHPATFADAVHGWQLDAAFRSLFNAVLAECPYTAFRWETPPVTESTMNRTFEFVVIDSPGLVQRPDAEAFAEHFRRASDSGVAVFPNLGADAIMVVPCPLAADAAYGHLAEFVRQAPEAQRHAVWQAVGDVMARRVGVDPVWLSTAGGGVAWVHVRLDNRPKYYIFEPYRRQADSWPAT